MSYYDISKEEKGLSFEGNYFTTFVYGNIRDLIVNIREVNFQLKTYRL